MRGRLVTAALLAVLGAVALPGSSRAAAPSCAMADQVAAEGDSGAVLAATDRLLRIMERRAAVQQPEPLTSDELRNRRLGARAR